MEKAPIVGVFFAQNLITTGRLMYVQYKQTIFGTLVAFTNTHNGNACASKEDALASLKELIEWEENALCAANERRILCENVAEKILSGYPPMDAHLTELFGMPIGGGYVKQSAVSWFLTEYLGVSKAKIRKALGIAGGVVTSDAGAKYPIAFPRLLHKVAWQA